jgi:hypothetical protein
MNEAYVQISESKIASNKPLLLQDIALSICIKGYADVVVGLTFLVFRLY